MDRGREEEKEEAGNRVTYLVAPTELQHAPLRALSKTGKSDPRPEKWGCDLAFKHDHKKYGIQRKEMKDFVASVNDKRLAKEIQQMRASVEQGVVVIEGNVRFSIEGEWLGRVAGPRWSRSAHLSALMSLQDEGVWVLNAADPQGTADVALAFQAWVEKGHHSLLTSTRGAARSLLAGSGAWGMASNEDFQRHLNEGLPGTGPELATRIRAAFDGVPFMWKPGAIERLRSVPGIGPVTIKKYLAAIPEEDTDGE